MGARSPINQRPRRGGIKCEFCTRNYPTAESLRAHQNSLHSLALKQKEKKRSALRKAGATQKATKVKLVIKQKQKPAKTQAKVVTKKSPVKPVYHESPTKQLASLVGSKVMDVSIEAKKEERVNKDLKPSTKMRKVEFQCPICIKTFPVYFSAIKHIQNKHQNHESSSSIEPVRKEFCIFCNAMVSNDKDKDHECEMRDLTGLGWTYVCAACEQKFTTTMHFDIHVREVHHEGVESMFFPNMDEFNEWKSTLEKQTNTSYVMIGRYHSKKIYRCSKYRNEDDTTTAYFCPSTLIFQEFTKGIQVHFYKEHFGHPCSKYVLSDSYKAYSITDMLHEATGYSEITNVRSAEDDLYCQFKKLMESIVVDAAKVNVEKLKVLTGKALQMISILKTYKAQDDDDEAPLSLNSNSSSDLTKALEILNNPKSSKRPVNAIEVVPAKRIRNQNGSPEKSPILQKALSKAKVTSNTFSLADDRDDQKILQELGGAKANVSSPIATPMKKTVESPSFNDTYKHFVEKNLKTTPLPVKASVPKKKTIVKTKMGQFKPNVSPKKPVKTDRTSRSSIGKASDIVYEIKEQENDCNILILKL